MTVDPNLDKLIRKHESGDFVTFNEFGKHIFRQLNGTELYNRVDKINLNNPKIVSPEKTGKRPFTQTETIKPIKSSVQDELAIETECRHIGHAYVPKKGINKEARPGVNQLQSNMDKVIKVEESRKDFASQSDKNFDSLSTMSARALGSSKYDFRDLKGHDILKWSNYQESTSKVGKKRVEQHPSQQSNGNFLHWNS